MNKSRIKLALLASAAILVMASAAGSIVLGHSSHAADDHGHGHAHEEEEDHHDKEGKEEHGHGHQEAGHEDSHGHGGGEEHAEGAIKLSPEQIAAAGIKTATAGTGALAREVAVPGKITAAADHMAQIVPKVAGTVTEARKNLGDNVRAGEILALIESREMAEAAADYLAARRAEELARTTFDREKSLWDRKITAEQDYLNARNVHQEAKIRLDLARQKLQALGHDDEALKALDTEGGTSKLRFHELRSPLPGRVIARELTLGEYVDATHAAFTVADLSVVWVEIAIAPGDLPFVKEGQAAHVTGSSKAQGKLIFVSPAIDPETRAAKAIIELENAEGLWRPGEFARAAITTGAQESLLTVTKEAIQSIGGKPAIFVRTDEGFEKRDVTTGREDGSQVEIIGGLSAGDVVAISNTFTLKAELGKAEAEHEH